VKIVQASETGGLVYERGLSAESKNPDGYQQGVAQRDSGTVSHTLPIQTEDNYKNFLIGYHDGAIQMDHDWNVHQPFTLWYLSIRSYTRGMFHFKLYKCI
jgi:hypothetical protein